MKLPAARHKWNLPPKTAIALQRRFSSEIKQVALTSPVRLVAGSDASFTRDGERIIAAWVVWDVRRGIVVDSSVEIRKVTFPYVPGLLSFREAPALLSAAKKLATEPDVLMLDGQGLAHPRRFGLACHVGLLAAKPALGCAKSRLCGDHAEPGAGVGSSRRLFADGEVIGRVVRTRAGTKPIYVSVGHLITLEEAVKLALRCCSRYRIPEPTRLAHHLVADHRRRLDRKKKREI